MTNGQPTSTINENKKIRGSITYIPNLTEKIKRSLRKPDYINKIGTKVNNTLAKSFKSTKDNIPKENRAGVIYKIPCECGKCYVGETSKTILMRLKQHECDVKYTRRNINNITHHRSALCKHSTECTNNFNFEQASMLDYEIKKKKRVFKEMCYITKNKNSINYKTDCRGLQHNYFSLLH